MADTLASSELEGIWSRVKKFIDLDTITSADRTNQQAELDNAMRSSQRSKREGFEDNMQTLVRNDFSKAFVDNSKIRAELLGSRIRQITVRGRSRFQVAGGTKATDGVRGGRFLSGRTMDEALADLKNKLR